MFQTEMFGFSFITFTYFVSTFFNKKHTAQKWIMLVLLLIGTIIPFFIFFIMMIDSEPKEF